MEADNMNRRIAENAAAIDALSSALRRTFRVISAEGSASGGETALGEYTVTGGAVAAVSFSGSGVLRFCGVTVAEGSSPLIAALPAGRGGLVLSGGGEARAVVFGGVSAAR